MATSTSASGGLIEVLKLSVSILLLGRTDSEAKAIFTLCNELPNLADSKLLAAAKKLSVENGADGVLNLAELRNVLALQKPVVEAIGKASSIKSFYSFFTTVEQLERMNLNSFLRALCAQTDEPTNDNADKYRTIDDYVADLKKSIHDEKAFDKIFEALKADKTMRQPDIAVIASAVAFPMAKSTKRQIALERIIKQHENSLTLGAKIDAQRGKSAA